MKENNAEILTWDIKTIINSIELVKEKLSIQEQKEYEQVKNGIKIKFPLIYYTKNWCTPIPRNQKMLIKGQDERPDINEFYEEIQERENKARKILLNNIKEVERFTGRLGET